MWRRVAPYPGYAVAPLLCRYFAGWRLTPYPAYKNRAARTLLVACPGPRLRSAAGTVTAPAAALAPAGGRSPRAAHPLPVA
ncbi:hypothetical protein ACP6DW_31300, partial [Klebsiella pneumoniae subsp. pneumoniae]